MGEEFDSGELSTPLEDPIEVAQVTPEIDPEVRAAIEAALNELSANVAAIDAQFGPGAAKAMIEGDFLALYGAAFMSLGPAGWVALGLTAATIGALVIASLPYEEGAPSGGGAQGLEKM